MIIKVIARKAYGQVRFYPVNNVAKQLALLTKTETFTFSMLMTAKRMGATIELTEGSHFPRSEDVENSQYILLGVKEG